MLQLSHSITSMSDRTCVSDNQLPKSNIHATTLPHYTSGTKGLEPLENMFNANPLT